MKTPSVALTIMVSSGFWLVGIIGCSRQAPPARVENPSAAQSANWPETRPDNRILELDGLANGMQVEDRPSLHVFTNAITIELWFQESSFYPNSGAVNSLIRKNVAAGSENFFLRFRTIAGRQQIEFCPGNRQGILTAPYPFRLRQWYHLAATYDGRLMQVFVNGALVKSAKADGPLMIDNSDLFIGKGDPDFSQGEYFHGKIDEVRLWNVARSPQEIQAAMTLTLTGREPGLVAYWDFDGQSAQDHSPGGNNGILLDDARITNAAPTTLSPSR